MKCENCGTVVEEKRIRELWQEIEQTRSKLLNLEVRYNLFREGYCSENCLEESEEA